jgi:hypothetical protein
VDEENDWQRQVFVGLVVLVTVGAIVGGVVALVTIKAADLAGIDDTAANTGIHRPRGGPTHSPTSGSLSPTTGATTDTTQPTGPTGARKPDRRFTLSANPLAVAASERIDLDGSCAALPSGTVVQVQRKEGGQWADFPVTATCSDGRYSTYVLTGHTGPNRFRVLALGRPEVSNTVVVQVS